jgi:hypothetical protein
MDMQGTRDFATASRSERTPGEPYRQTYQVIVLRIHVSGASGRHFAWQLARIDLYLDLAASDGHPDTKTFGVDKICLRRKAN